MLLAVSALCAATLTIAGAVLMVFAPREPARPVAGVRVLGAPLMPSRSPAPEPGVTRVMIDPGHGGLDQGGSGRTTTDRDVAFAVALEVKRQLDLRPHLQGLLTRDTDRFLKLEERTAIARDAHADCFVSLHANVWRGAGSPEGVQVSYASEALAARELADQLTARGLATDAAWPFLLTQRTTLERSRLLAYMLLDGVVGHTGQRARSVQRNAYKVLRPYEIPSCLVELGFLTNTSEEALMATPAWREHAATGVVAAIEQWARLSRDPASFAQALASLPPEPVPPPVRTVAHAVARAPAPVRAPATLLARQRSPARRLPRSTRTASSRTGGSR